MGGFLVALLRIRRPYLYFGYKNKIEDRKQVFLKLYESYENIIDIRNFGATPQPRET